MFGCGLSRFAGGSFAFGSLALPYAQHVNNHILLLAVAAAVYALRGGGKETENRIVVSGNIELTEVSVGFKSAGRLVERSVNEGDPVTKGQVLARLDRDQLSASSIVFIEHSALD